METALSVFIYLLQIPFCLPSSSLLHCKIPYVLLLKKKQPHLHISTSTTRPRPALKDLGNCFCSWCVILVFAKCLLILCLHPFKPPKPPPPLPPTPKKKENNTLSTIHTAICDKELLLIIWCEKVEVQDMGRKTFRGCHNEKVLCIHILQAGHSFVVWVSLPVLFVREKLFLSVSDRRVSDSVCPEFDRQQNTANRNWGACRGFVSFFRLRSIARVHHTDLKPHLVRFCIKLDLECKRVISSAYMHFRSVPTFSQHHCGNTARELV